MARLMGITGKKPTWKNLNSFFPIVLSGYSGNPYRRARFSGTFNLVAAVAGTAGLGFKIDTTTIYTAAAANTSYVSVSPPLGSGTASPTSQIQVSSTARFALAGYGGSIPDGLQMNAFAFYKNTSGVVNIFSPASSVSVYYVCVSMFNYLYYDIGSPSNTVEFRDSSPTTWEVVTSTSTGTALDHRVNFEFEGLGPNPLVTLSGSQSLQINISYSGSGTPTFLAHGAGIVLYS